MNSGVDSPPRARLQPLLVLLALPLALAGSFLSYRSVREYQSIGPAIAHASEVLETSTSLRTNVRAAESGQRGYMLTSRLAFLEPYSRALPKIERELLELSRLLAVEPDQQARLDQIRQLVNEKLAELNQTVDLARSGQGAHALAVMNNFKGPQLMEPVAILINELQTAEQTSLREQTARTAASAQTAFLISGLGDLVLIVLLAVVAVVLGRENRKNARHQDAIRSLNERLESELHQRTAILQSIGDGFCAFDETGQARYCNAAAQQILGMTGGTVEGMHVTKLFPDEPKIAAVIQDVARGGLPSTLESFYSQYGRWLRTRFYPVPSFGFSAYITDITEENKAAIERENLFAEVQEARALLDTFFDAAPVGFGFWDCELRFNRANAAMRAMMSLPEAYRGISLTALLPGLDPAVEANLRIVLHDGTSIRSQEISAVLTDRSCHYVASFYPIRINGSIVGAGSIWEDITERKAIEGSLRQSAKLESLGVLAGGVAHDFNNLLTGILGNASLALDTVSQNNPARAVLQDVVRASERASHLTRQLLAYAGKGRFVLERLNLSEVVREISGLVKTSIGHHVQLRLRLDEHLPTIHADGSQMQQLIMNLVINAAEAIQPEQQGTVIVATGAHDVDENYIRQTLAPAVIEPGRYVFLEVHDTGLGMDAETVARIFDPFFTTKFTGRGLGLAAVMGIIRGHKGSIKVYSTPGQGTTFKVLLPVSEGGLTKHTSASVHDDLSGTATILVVDDEDVVRRTTRTTLERYGYDVVLAENGRECLDLFRDMREKIALVLLDLTMPVMSGEQALRELRALRPDLPVILSSGYNEQETIQRFTGKNLAGFLQKPYTAQRLAESVRKALQKQGNHAGV